MRAGRGDWCRSCLPMGADPIYSACMALNDRPAFFNVEECYQYQSITYSGICQEGDYLAPGGCPCQPTLSSQTQSSWL